MSEYTRTFAGLLSKMWDQNPNTRPPAQQAILTLCNLTDKPDTSGGSAPLLFSENLEPDSSAPV